MSWTCSSPGRRLAPPQISGGVAVALSGAVACAHAVATVPHLDSEDPVEATLRNAKGGNTLVRCQPADAELAVDGVVRGLASDFDGRERLLALPTGGDHRVGFRHQGYEAVVVDVVVEEKGARRWMCVSRRSGVSSALAELLTGERKETELNRRRRSHDVDT